ncbi:MAG: hypothetical protein FWD74_01115 [Actinomycetia bacterium]|nr:hypothetical protein [Actinomycetes bacterium]
MKQRDDVEQILREVFRDIAATTDADGALTEQLIGAAKSRVRPTTSHRRRVSRGAWLKPVLAAAVVAVISGGIALVAQLPRHGGPASGPSSSTTPSASGAPGPTNPARSPTAISTGTTSPSVSGGPQPMRCTVPLPASWRAAMADPVLQASGVSTADGLVASSGTLAVAPNGDALAFRTTAAAPRGQLVLIAPNRSVRVLYNLPTLDPGPGYGGPVAPNLYAAQVNTQWAVFALGIPAGQSITAELVAVRLADGATRVVRPQLQGKALMDVIISDPVLLNNSLFWREADASGVGSVYRFDLTVGSRATLATGQLYSEPQLVGGAVTWTTGTPGDAKLHWYGTPSMPAGFTVNPGKGAPFFLRDGSNYAWQGSSDPSSDQRDTILLSLGSAPPTVVYTAPNKGDSASPQALSGPYLVFDDTNNLIVLDTRTGAATQLAQYQPGTRALAAGGTIAINQTDAKASMKLILLRTDELPELHC